MRPTSMPLGCGRTSTIAPIGSGSCATCSAPAAICSIVACVERQPIDQRRRQSVALGALQVVPIGRKQVGPRRAHALRQLHQGAELRCAVVARAIVAATVRAVWPTWRM